MTPKVMLAAAAAAAITLGLVLPVPRNAEAQPATQSQFETISLGR